MPINQRPVRVALLVVVCIAAGSTSSFAHPSAAEEIRRVSETLREHDDATLLLRRAELRRISGHWDLALQDCDAISRLDPDLHAVRLCRSRIELDRGRPEAAVSEARAYLDREVTAAGYRIMARALAEAGKGRQAAHAFERAADLAEVPDPADYLNAASALVSRGVEDPAAALAALDRGVERLGPLVALLSTAVEASRQAGHPEAALERVDRIVAQVSRSEGWVAERGRILLSMDRIPEAWVAFSESLAAIEQLPDHLRAAPATRLLEEELRELLHAPTDGSTP